MSCYSKHPEVPGIECWHGPGHAGDHGKEHRRWPNASDPVQVELEALREVARAADDLQESMADHYSERWMRLRLALKAATR